MERGVKQPRILRCLEHADRLVHHLAPIAPSIHAQRRQVVGRKHVGNFEIRIGWIGIQYEWIVTLAKEAGILPVRHVAASVADGVRHKNERRNITLRPLQLGKDGAEVRILDAALK